VIRLSSFDCAASAFKRRSSARWSRNCRIFNKAAAMWTHIRWRPGVKHSQAYALILCGVMITSVSKESSPTSTLATQKWVSISRRFRTLDAWHKRSAASQVAGLILCSKSLSQYFIERSARSYRAISKQQKYTAVSHYCEFHT